MNKQICRKCGAIIFNDFNETLSFCTNCGASKNHSLNYLGQINLREVYVDQNWTAK